MALWRARTLAPEKKPWITEEQLDQENQLVPHDNGSSFHIEDANMLKIYSASLPVDVSGQLLDLPFPSLQTVG